MDEVIVIGAGVAGLSAAANLAAAGRRVTVLEKNDSPGGRASVCRDNGFLFEKGPSWYWMPEIMEGFFQRYNFSSSDFFDLKRLDPSYRVFLKDGFVDVPATFSEIQALFESMEKGAGQMLEKFMHDAKRKYDISLNGFIMKPSLSIAEYMNPGLLQPAMRLNLFSSFYKHARKYFKSPEILKIIEFPVLFLGGTPHTIPAMYSLMNYADSMLGTWYPMGGFNQLPLAMEHVCRSLGVKFNYNEEIQKFHTDNDKVTSVHSSENSYNADAFLSSADYAFMDGLLEKAGMSNYSKDYWDKRVMAPSALLFFLGLNTRVIGLQHHNLFFEPDFYTHAASIYSKPGWPEDPLFYACCPSLTDASVAPEGSENIFLLIPLTYDLDPDEGVMDTLFEKIMARLHKATGTDLRNHIVVKRQFTRRDFRNEYNAFKGNAYGLSNTLKQTAFLKPAIRHRKLKNLFYAGQLTVPGPGVPPSILSGKISSDYLIKKCFNER